MIKEWVDRLWQYFLQVNLYKKASSTEETVAHERILTRIYLVLLCCLLLAIGITSASIVHTVRRTETTPSAARFQYLDQRYHDTLQCPCSKGGIAYKTFLFTDAKFHQVCSSEYVTQSWVDTVFAEDHSFLSTGDNFRETLSFFWQTIASLCQASNQTWTAAIADFSDSYIISPKAVAEEQIRDQSGSALRHHIASTEAVLSSTLGALQRSIAGNQFVSALASNFYLDRPTTEFGDWPTPRMSPRIFNDCSCMRMAGCPRPAMVNDSRGELVRVPGMITDCLVVDATLASTLECYYDRACMSLLHGSDSENVGLLSSNGKTTFSRNTTVQALLDKIFIDELDIKISFELFYGQCQPAHCSYSYSHRFDKMFVVTTLIGVFGGLSFLLRYTVKFTAMAILRCRKKGKAVEQTPADTPIVSKRRKRLDIIGRVKKLITAIQQKLWSLNLFESEVAEENVREQERIITRVFILALIACCAISGFYIFIVQQEELITVLQPTAEEYQSLYKDYSGTLLCPCSQLSVPYGKLLNVSYDLHQMCSSDMVSAEWLDYLISFNPTQVPPFTEITCARDFRTFGASYFQFLNTFCSLARDTIESGQTTSRSKQLINSNVPPPGIFSQQVNATIEASVTTAKNRFTRMLTWIYINNLVNQILTGTQVNFDVAVAGNQVSFSNAAVSRIGVIDHERGPAIGGLCPCAGLDNSCQLGLLLYKNASLLKEYARYFKEIPIGCIPYHGFSRSSIAWWYDKDYIEDIRETYTYLIQSQPAPAIRPLNQSISTKFYDKTVRNLLDEMFVESTTHEPASFDSLYSECAPKSCSYKIVRRREIFVALVLLISVCGGLSRGLRLLIPLLSKCTFFCLEKWRNRSNAHRQYPASHYLICIFVFLVRNNSCLGLRQAWKNFITSIRFLNLFRSQSTNQADLNLQYIHTRAYLLVLIACLSILLFYSSIIERSGTRTVPFPSPSDYEHLLGVYPDNLNCPCTRIAIPYSDFVTQLRVTSFHQACNLTVLKNILTVGQFQSYIGYSDPDNFYTWQNIFYNGVNRLCQLASDYVGNNTQIFLSSPMLTYQMIPRSMFKDEVNTTVDRFQRTLPITFAQTLDLLRAMVRGNALIAIFSANWNTFVVDNTASFRSEQVVHTRADTNATCSCATDRFCSKPTVSKDTVYNRTVPSPPGIVSGCNLLESILQSSLSCFYSLECVNETRRLMRLSGELIDDLSANVEYWMNKGYTMSLNASATHFSVNDTLEKLAHAMFIESWTSETSYERFFNACAPNYCTGTYYYRFDALDVLTTFLSVYSGLTVVLRFLTPLGVSAVVLVRNRLRSLWSNGNRIQTFP